MSLACFTGHLLRLMHTIIVFYGKCYPLSLFILFENVKQMSEDGALKISEHSSGLFTVSVCVMSNFSKSRVLALQLLTRMCHIPKGHTMVADAISMLRLKFGEPVRFKFLIGKYSRRLTIST